MIQTLLPDKTHHHPSPHIPPHGTHDTNLITYPTTWHNPCCQTKHITIPHLISHHMAHMVQTSSHIPPHGTILVARENTFSTSTVARCRPRRAYPKQLMEITKVGLFLVDDMQTTPLSKTAVSIFLSNLLRNVLKIMKNQFSDFCYFYFFELWSILCTIFKCFSPTKSVKKKLSQKICNVCTICDMR